MKRSTRELVQRVYNACTITINYECKHYKNRTDEQNRAAYRLQEKWADLYDVCADHEKKHRRLGKALNQSMKGRSSVETAAQYFAAKAILREAPTISTWREVLDIRLDWAQGFAIGEILSFIGSTKALHERIGVEDLAKFEALDYAKDLV